MRSFFKKFLLGAATMLIALTAMILLPHDRYLRWQAVQTEAFARLGWIFERIHYDNTPIDIAFIGTSHTMMGLDTPALEQTITAAGIRPAEPGRCLHAVNLAVPSYGRDMHWLIARELLTNRKIKTLVLEVFENETRHAHPVFVHVADTGDILNAPVLLNLNYLHNLVRLPYRQLSLWLKSLAPAAFGLHPNFDAADYDGSDIDNTRIINVRGAEISPYRKDVIDSAKLEKIAAEHRAAKNLHMLGAWAEPYEYAVPDHYVTSLLDLARATNTDVVFLYLPQYGMPPKPAEDRLYKNRGDWIFANNTLQHPEFWSDEAHLNAQGAADLTQRVAEALIARWKSSPETLQKDSVAIPAEALACTDHAYPIRTALKPFHPTRKNYADAEDTQ